MSNLYALLIGIDDYDDREVNGIRYPNLGSAVRDINHVHAFLRDYLHVCPTSTSSSSPRLCKAIATHLAPASSTRVA